MEIKVREVRPIESKGVQELEEELLNKHEEQIQVQAVSMDHQTTPAPAPEPTPELESELQPEPQPEPQHRVLSYRRKTFFHILANATINKSTHLMSWSLRDPTSNCPRTYQHT